MESGTAAAINKAVYRNWSNTRHDTEIQEAKESFNFIADFQGNGNITYMYKITHKHKVNVTSSARNISAHFRTCTAILRDINRELYGEDYSKSSLRDTEQAFSFNFIS